MKRHERLIPIKMINNDEDKINGTVYQGNEIVVHLFDRTGAGRKDIFRMPSLAVFATWALDQDGIVSITNIEQSLGRKSS